MNLLFLTDRNNGFASFDSDELTPAFVNQKKFLDQSIMNKKSLRKQYLNMRLLIAESDRIAMSRKIADIFFENIDVGAVRWLHRFMSVAGQKEVESEFIADNQKVREKGIRIAVPRVDLKSKTLEQVLTDSDTVFAESKWGIREPVGGKVIRDELFDLIIVPLLAYDRLGNRIGYGGGYYDKFLANSRKDCLKVGVSFFPPDEEDIQVEPHDIPLDCCVTPERFHDFRKS